MRLYPPAWIVARRAIEEDVIGGYRIPKDPASSSAPMRCTATLVTGMNPDAFDPDRFSPALSAARPRFSYFPFAAGPRMCIGNAFAMMEMQIVVATILRACQLDLVPSFQLELAPQVTLRPAHEIPVHIRPAPRPLPATEVDGTVSN